MVIYIYIITVLVHGAGKRIKLIRIEEKSEEIMVKYLTNEFNEAKKKVINEKIMNSEVYKGLRRKERKEYLEKEANEKLKEKLFTKKSAELYYKKIGSDLRSLEEYLPSDLSVEGTS